MKLFIPVSDNGSGAGKTGWAIALASSFNGRHVQFQQMGGSHADRMCNQMANAFLKTDCDVMLIIDIDTIFRQQDVDRAMSHIARGIKAVWGLYPKKQDDAPPCINTWPEVPSPDEFGLINVRRAGRGFLAITRGVFEALKEENGGPAKKFFNHDEPEWSFFHSGIVTGDRSAMTDGSAEWISEDWKLCEDLRLFLKVPTLVDTGIVLKHVGEKTYSFPAELVIRTDSNITSWQEIHGWFDYEDFYRFLIGEIPDGGNFCEVGCWLGRSIAAFHSFAKEAGKAIQINVVDTFEGRPENDIHRALLETHGGNVMNAFLANMKALGVPAGNKEGERWIFPEGSPKGADQFADKSLNAVFIDGDHSEACVRADIAAWLPKVKEGGIIAGHDADEPGVEAVIAEYDDVNIMGRVWWTRV